MHPLHLLPLLPLAASQAILPAFTFGQNDRIDDGIANYNLTGRDHAPAVFSDRVQLTPPHPGNKRGALFSREPLHVNYWDITLSFRASGPERGSGNLHLWYTAAQNQPGADLSQGSVYSAERFDGLALVIDQYGGAGGTLRGFLNDGTRSFRAASNVDAWAFGRCDFAYRNLGRFADIRVAQGPGGLDVQIDGKPCFRADSIQLPSHYYLAVVAASAETPDSFEVSKLLVRSGDASREEPLRVQHEAAAGSFAEQVRVVRDGQVPHGLGGQQQAADGGMGAAPDKFATRGAGADAEKLGAVQNALETLLLRVANLEGKADRILAQGTGRNAQGMESPQGAITAAQIEGLERRLASIEGLVTSVKRDVEGRDYKESLRGLSESLRETREGLSGLVTGNAPRMGFFVGVVLLFQVALAASYVYYKRRMANSPKKMV